jgi:hypothetical protein
MQSNDQTVQILDECTWKVGTDFSKLALEYCKGFALFMKLQKSGYTLDKKRVGTYRNHKLGQILVLQLRVIEELLRDSRYQREKLELVQLLVGRHGDPMVDKCIVGMLRVAVTASNKS